MDNVVVITWNDKELRFEGYIGDKIKAYTRGNVVDGEVVNTKEGHEQGKKEMVELFERKGYKIDLEG